MKPIFWVLEANKVLSNITLQTNEAKIRVKVISRFWVLEGNKGLSNMTLQANEANIRV